MIHRTSHLRKTCLALAVQVSRQFAPPRYSLVGTRLASVGNFEPASPPGTHGTPVFPDINFESSRKQASTRNTDPDAVFVVTGASRGIGFQMVKSLYESTQGAIVACCRTPDSAKQLQEFVEGIDNPSRIQTVSLNLEKQDTIEELGAFMKEKYNRVDMLLNVAGLLGDGKSTSGPERSLAKVDRDWIEKTMAINTIGPIMLAQELSPFMKQSRKKNDTNDRASAIMVNMSARVGSISDNGLGGWYSYRISKSAINQFTRTAALEMKRHNVWCVSLHPGTTETDLSKPFQANVKAGSLFPVEFTVEKLLDVINSLDESNSGGFYDWSGQSLSF